jgi:iron complex transport system substrate-binding protein
LLLNFFFQALRAEAIVARHCLGKRRQFFAPAPAGFGKTIESFSAPGTGFDLGFVLQRHKLDCTLIHRKKHFIPHELKDMVFNLKFSGWAVAFLLFQAVASAQSPTPTATDVVPRRIISMAPNLTQIVYDIGAQDMLVGVTDFCKFPPAARSKEKIGGWINPNYEKILSLKPDLVIALKFHGKAVDNLRKLNVPVLVLDCMTIQDVLDAYDVLGKELGRQKDARRAKARLSKRLKKVKAEAKNRKPVPVLFVIDRTPGALEQIYGVGPNNFVDELIRWSGGENMLSDAKEPYPLVSKEQLLKRDPEVIVNALAEAHLKSNGVEGEAAVWNALPSLKAVKNHHVYCFTNEDFLIPGPTMANLAEYLSHIFEEARKK